MGLKTIIEKVQRGIESNDKNILRYFWDISVGHGLTNFLPDKIFLSLGFKIRTGKRLDLQNPVSFNEKIQWLKLYDRRPEYSIMVDKYEVKKYVTERIGEKYIIPTIGIFNEFDEIDFKKLPEQFVIKCTHDSGGLVIVKDKERLNIQAAKRKITRCLNVNYYYLGREWAYKNVKPRIIIEKYIEDPSSKYSEGGLFDYKIFCFDGIPKIIQVDFNRFIEHKRNLYTPDWNYINAQIEYPTDPNFIVEKPAVLDEMLSLASKLSMGIPLVRVDLYCIQNQIYFGELTLYHGSGTERFIPESFGKEMGSYIKLPKKSA